MTHLTSSSLATGIVVAFMFTGCSRPADSNEQATTADTTHATPPSARPVHWGYAGEAGPNAWATLTPVYSLCGEGKSQSPINIEKSETKGGASWKLDYKTTSLRIAHNEHMEDIIDN